MRDVVSLGRPLTKNLGIDAEEGADFSSESGSSVDGTEEPVKQTTKI